MTQKNKEECVSKTYCRLHNILLVWHPRRTLDLWREEGRIRDEKIGNKKMRHEERGQMGSRKKSHERRGWECVGGCKREVRKR